MAKRFGRNQRRKLLERNAALSALAVVAKEAVTRVQRQNEELRRVVAQYEASGAIGFIYHDVAIHQHEDVVWQRLSIRFKDAESVAIEQRTPMQALFEARDKAEMLGHSARIMASGMRASPMMEEALSKAMAARLERTVAGWRFR